MLGHPGKALTEREVDALFGQSYMKAATIGNAVHRFAACIIEPFNSMIFSDDDFASAATTDCYTVPNIPGKSANRDKDMGPKCKKSMSDDTAVE